MNKEMKTSTAGLRQWKDRQALSTALISALFALLLLPSCALNPPPFDEAAWREKVKSENPALLYASHFKDGRFFNPWLPNKEKGFLNFLRWRFSPTQDYTEQEKGYRPRFIENAAKRIRAMPEGDFIMWIGHATFLLRLNGAYWLTDPIFSERAFLPKRKTPPGITLEALGKIAPKMNIVISHNHYDHLDKESILALSGRSKIYVPLGLKDHVQGMNQPQVLEMDWWQSIDAGSGTTLVSLPAQHWSRRIGQGVNETLWASYMLITPRVTIYFGGDSGYFIGYKEIAKRYPGIDYALLPTTAYHPRWFMHHSHMNIDETVRAFTDLKARFMIPHQWGTFHLGDEPVGYPVLELKKTIAERRLDPARYLVMDIGEIHTIPDRQP